MQVLPASRYKSGSQKFSEAFMGMGQSLGKSVNENIQRQDMKRRYSEALKGAETAYSDPNLTPEQRFIKAFSSMKDFPEMAKQFSSGMDKFYESPLQKAQTDKIKAETSELGKKEEESYLNLGEFDKNNPETWDDKTIKNLMSYKGKDPKKQSLAKRAELQNEANEKKKKETVEFQEKVNPIKGAMDVLTSMRNISKRGNLGIGVGPRGFIMPSVRKDAAEYERLGKSLIAFSTNIPIRNQKEFETLAHDLYDPSLTDATREGILNAMEMILQNAMKSLVMPEGMQQSKPPASVQATPAAQERPPLTSFYR